MTSSKAIALRMFDKGFDAYVAAVEAQIALKELAADYDLPQAQYLRIKEKLELIQDVLAPIVDGTV